MSNKREKNAATLKNLYFEKKDPDGIKSCLEYYSLLFLFDACFHFLHNYVRVLSLWNFGFGDVSPFNFIYSYKFLLVFC